MNNNYIIGMVLLVCLISTRLTSGQEYIKESWFIILLGVGIFGAVSTILSLYMFVQDTDLNSYKVSILRQVRLKHQCNILQQIYFMDTFIF